MRQFRTRFLDVIESIWMKFLLIVVAVALILIVGSMIGDDDFTSGADGEAIFPSESLTDWVSYAQQMSVVTVVDEARIEPPARVYEHDEGYVGRMVTIRIDKTVWHADGVDPFPAGTELSYTGFGWHYKDGEYIPFAQQLDMGERYLMPIVRGGSHYPDVKGYPLTADTRLPLQGDRVDPDLETNNPAVKLTIGKTVGEVGEMLEQTSPDPLALKYSYLDPVERVRAVFAEKNSSGETEAPTPAESTEVPSGS